MSISLALLAIHSVGAAEMENDSAELGSITVTASADASAEGLSRAHSGGQVAVGGRAGILGTLDHLDSPFSITAYTNEFIQDRQARSVGDVLQNDPSVRVARGFGNFQESYFIRGFVLSSDDIAYNGLYSLLPRQYIATELFERVELLRGASSFLSGASPSGGGIGGNVNLLPKRAPNEPFNRITVGTEHGKQGLVSADIARRFGEEKQFGVRVNTAYRDGGTAIDDEETQLGLFSVGLDWRGDRARLSADIGYQDNQLDETRTNVTLLGLDRIPSAPSSDSNWAQPWSYSDEQDWFGTMRGEYDVTETTTAWAAYGLRRTEEENSLANIRVTDANSGQGNFFRFDNARKDEVDTGELGLRGLFNTGNVGHEWVMSASFFELDSKNAYGTGSTLLTNLYNPIDVSQPPLGFQTNSDLTPTLTNSVQLQSYAIGDTLSFFDEKFLLTLGIRRQTIEVKTYDYSTGDKTSDYKATENTPVVGMVYKLTPQLSVYGNYIESLRQGETAPEQFNGIDLVNRGEAQSPYVAEQKEIGLKYDSDYLGWGLAYFTTDMPRSFTDTSDPANPVFETSGENNHQGIELTTFGLLTDDIKLLGGVTWLDAKQDKTGSDDLDGNRVVGIPEYQANIGAVWEVPQVSGLALDSRIIYTGSMYADSANDLKLPSWTRVDIGARYLMQVNGKDLTLRARVNNVFDRDYWASAGGYVGANGTVGTGYLVLGAPRTVTLTATMDF
jgi:iron complex outermembrane receptor protein